MKANPFVVKAFAILVIVGLLMLALGRIGYLAEERQQRFREAEASIEQSQAGRQALLGPVLYSSCIEEWDAVSGEGKDRTVTTGRREFMLSAPPHQLNVQASVAMEPRYRGLFKINTYVAKMQLKAQWAPLTALRPLAEHAGGRLNCQAPALMVGVSDARGIRQAQVQVAGNSLVVVAGTGHRSHPRGFHVLLPEAVRQGEQPFSADVALELVGTSDLALAPVADDTRMQLDANWPHPSFGGRFLPVTRDVRESGFTAAWQVSSLATTAPLDFARGLGLRVGEGAESQGIESFSVSFIDPVNPYSLSDRAIKYGLLFIALTFVAVAMVEVMRRLRVHPIQYLLVGCALSIFFLLLLSLSEHLSFALSYALASVACVGLLTFYGAHLLHGWRAGGLFGAGVAGLYAALYALLQMEQTALVIGSVLLFVVLAAVMTLTRRVDWYGLLRAPSASA